MNLNKFNTENIKRGLFLSYKDLRTMLNSNSKGAHSLIYITGAQRSGTSIALKVFEQSYDVKTYGEGHPDFFRGLRLPSEEEVRNLLRSSNYPIILAKPLVDSQHMKSWLEAFNNLKVIWMFRNYNDVVRSANKKWPGHQLDVIHRLARRDWERLTWRGENISDHTIQQFDSLYRQDLNEEEGGALFWWLRNRILLDDDLIKHKRLHLLDYDHIIKKPEQAFLSIFQWSGIAFNKKFIENVKHNINNSKEITINSDIRKSCQDLFEKLKNEYKIQTGSSILNK